MQKMPEEGQKALSPTQLKKLLEITGSFDEYLIEDFQKNPKNAETYLEIALEEFEEDRNMEYFLQALRTLANAKGGLTALAEKTNLSRQNLYRALSPKGNPTLSTLTEILSALGFRLSVTSLSDKKR